MKVHLYMVLLNNANTLEGSYQALIIIHSKDKYYRRKYGKTLVRGGAGRNLGSAAKNSPQQEERLRYREGGKI